MPWTGEKLLGRARRSWASRRTVPGFLFAEEIPSAVSADECRKLAELAAGKVVLEVGSYFGRSTVAIASTASAVHSIDLHPPDDLGLGLSSTAAALVENLERYDLRHKVVLHIGFSQLILPALRRESFDLVFLDAQHEPDPVREDLQAILPLVRPEGMLAFHDYGVPGVQHHGRWDTFGVTEAVDAFAAERGRQVEVTRTLAVVRLRADD